jgi:hypothetical protein
MNQMGHAGASQSMDATHQKRAIDDSRRHQRADADNPEDGNPGKSAANDGGCALVTPARSHCRVSD